MTTTSVLLTIGGVLLGALAAWAFVETARAARSTRLLAEETRARLTPLLDKVDVTVDAANAELLRIDGVITTFEDASVRFGSAAGTVTNIVHAPADIANEMAGRVRRAWKRRQTAEPSQPGADSENPEEPAETAVAVAETHD